MYNTDTEIMIKVITITYQCGSGGSEFAHLVAHKLGWELLDRGLVERVARVADLGATAAGFDDQAARWCEVLRARGIDLDELCPRVAPRWFDQPDEDSTHALAVELIRAAADFGECVIAVPGAQCSLQGRAGVFNVLVYAPLQERVARIQDRNPECTDIEAFLRKMDVQTARYMLEHYESEWLGMDLYLYDLCVNSSTGLDAAAALITAELMPTEKSCTPTAEEEPLPCHLRD
jgi:CMP/dCMP kinase